MANELREGGRRKYLQTFGLRPSTLFCDSYGRHFGPSGATSGSRHAENRRSNANAAENVRRSEGLNERLWNEYAPKGGNYLQGKR